MKIKHMTRENWKELVSKEYIIQDSFFEKGRTSLINILEVTEPVSFTFLNGEPFVMCDVGYHWLQIAYENKPYWITAFFDPNDQLIQIYIDLIGKTDFSNPDNPSMNDLYVDVVIEFDQYHILDLDEFEDAYQNHVISKDEYETTKVNYHELCHYLDEHIKEFIDQVKQEYLHIRKSKQD